MCEIFVSTEQIFEPKNSARRLDDGTMVSAPLEDLAPFLPREELAENMFIDRKLYGGGYNRRVVCNTAYGHKVICASPFIRRAA